MFRHTPAKSRRLTPVAAGGRSYSPYFFRAWRSFRKPKTFVPKTHRLVFGTAPIVSGIAKMAIGIFAFRHWRFTYFGLRICCVYALTRAHRCVSGVFPARHTWAQKHPKFYREFRASRSEFAEIQPIGRLLRRCRIFTTHMAPAKIVRAARNMRSPMRIYSIYNGQRCYISTHQNGARAR